MALGSAVLVFGAGVPGAESAGGSRSKPPRPVVRSHGEMLHAALSSYCRPDASGFCSVPAILISTRKRLPVHAHGKVRVNTRVPAKKVNVDFGGRCGHPSALRQVSKRRWTFRVSRALAAGSPCRDVSLEIFYKGGGLRGTIGYFGFGTKPHRHGSEAVCRASS